MVASTSWVLCVPSLDVFLARRNWIWRSMRSAIAQSSLSVGECRRPEGHRPSCSATQMLSTGTLRHARISGTDIGGPTLAASGVPTQARSAIIALRRIAGDPDNAVRQQGQGYGAPIPALLSPK